MMNELPSIDERKQSLLEARINAGGRQPESESSSYTGGPMDIDSRPGAMTPEKPNRNSPRDLTANSDVEERSSSQPPKYEPDSATDAANASPVTGPSGRTAGRRKRKADQHNEITTTSSKVRQATLDDFMRQPAGSSGAGREQQPSPVAGCAVGAAEMAAPAQQQLAFASFAETATSCGPDSSSTYYEQKVKEQSRRIDELENELERSRNQHLLDETRIKNCINVIEELLIEKSRLERKQAREASMKDRLRIGSFVVMPSIGEPNRMTEQWRNGEAYEQIDEKRRKLQVEEDALKLERKELSKIKPTGAQMNMNQGPNSVQDWYEQDELIKLRQTTINKKRADLDQEMERLNFEKNLAMREIKRIHYEDASKFSDFQRLKNGRYLMLSLLGKGGFGEVHRAYDLYELRYVAVKIHQVDSRWSKEKQENYVKHACREYRIHRDLSCPRIVPLYDVFEIDAVSFATVMEYYDGCDLDFWLKQNGSISEKDARNVVVQVMHALRYLNDRPKPIVHYDLTPKNILLGPHGVSGPIKLTDFGLSKIIEVVGDRDGPAEIELTSFGAGCYHYLPPECLTENSMIDSKVDVWSLGVILFQCLYGKKPYGDEKTQREVWHTRNDFHRNLELPLRPVISDGAKRFIMRCLQRHRSQRPSVLELSKDDFLKPVAMKKKLEQFSAAPPATALPLPSSAAASNAAD